MWIGDRKDMFFNRQIHSFTLHGLQKTRKMIPHITVRLHEMRIWQSSSTFQKCAFSASVFDVSCAAASFASLTAARASHRRSLYELVETVPQTHSERAYFLA